MDLFCALLGLAVIFLALILFVKHKHSYWKRLGIPYVQPHPVFGNVKEMITTEHSSITMQRCYNQMKGKGIIGGIYMFYNPMAIVLKPDLIKHILIKDFNNFNHRGVYHNQKDDPISGHLFALEGEQWKNLRTKLSPTFTSGKLKMMFETILKVTQEFTEYVSEYAVIGANIEMKDILARYTTDIIGTCAFGLECNSLRNPDSEFRRIGKRALELEPLEALKVFVVSAMPAGLAHKLGLITTPKEVSKFFLGTIHETIEYREKNKVERNDFMNLLIQLKNHGKFTDEDKELGKITLDEIAAQCFVFFLAGFETSSSTMTFCLFELAQNAIIQERLREEIMAVIAKHDNQLSYEAAMEMPYLDQVINGKNVPLNCCFKSHYLIPKFHFRNFEEISTSRYPNAGYRERLQYPRLGHHAKKGNNSIHPSLFNAP